MTDTAEDSAADAFDHALAQKALADIRAMVTGNGIAPETVDLNSCEGAIVDFGAEAFFTIESTVTEKKENGKKNGETAGSYADAQQKIKTATEKLTADPDVWGYAIGMLKKRKDLGFAVPDLVLMLNRLDRRFVVHETCNPCHGTGQTLCRTCKGHRKIPCMRCRGTQDVPCQTCRGVGQVFVSGNQKMCTDCQGRGHRACPLCRRTGETPCRVCAATGKEQCGACAGTGWHSTVFLMAVKAVGRFVYDKAALPAGVAEWVDRFGPALVTAGHGLARIVDDRATVQERSAAAHAEEFAVSYRMKLPWAALILSIGGRQVEGRLFGYNALPVAFPPFLEEPLAAPLAALARAAQGRGDPAAMRQAARARLIARLFTVAATYPPQKTAAVMRKKYPVGLAPETLKTIAGQAAQALAHVTRVPRRRALAFGVLAVGLCDALWFASPLRAFFVTALSGAVPEFVLDAGMLFAGAGGIAAAIHLAALRTLRRVLGRKTGRTLALFPALFLGAGAAAGVFALVLLGCALAGLPLPDWCPQALHGG